MIKGKPERLKVINDEFIKEVNTKFGAKTYENYIAKKAKGRANFKNPKVHQFFTDLKSVVDYGQLSDDKDYSSYDLTSNLGVRSCIYCNRTYAITQRKRSNNKGGRLMNPQLDHWFSQKDYPLLSISFHNLIPSCEICNSRIKNDTELNLKDHFHPYQDEFASITFGYRFSFFNQRYQVFFKNPTDSKILATCKILCIDQMYDAHNPELEDLINLKKYYSETYLMILKKTFPEANLTDEMIFRLAFGAELKEENFHKSPLSKFKHDILVELGIIKKP